MLEVLTHDLFGVAEPQWPGDEISDAIEQFFGADDYHVSVKFDIPSLPAHALPSVEERHTIPSCDAPLSQLVKVCCRTLLLLSYGRGPT
jgi:hypothetical protein